LQDCILNICIDKKLNANVLPKYTNK